MPERYQTLYDAAQAHLGDWLEVMPTTTGMHTVAYLRHGLDAERCQLPPPPLAASPWLPISRFCTEPFPRQGLVLGFRGFGAPQIEQGVRVLRGVFEGLRAAA